MIRILMLYFILLPVLAVYQPAVSKAAEPKDETIIELLQVMNTMENMEASLGTMKDTIKMNSPYFIKEIKVILARELEEKYVQIAAEAYRQEGFGAARLYELFRYKFNFDKIRNEIMIPVYKEHYSESEIQELIEFYKSDLGQKTLQLSPTITQSISSKTRDISEMALNQAKEELASELKNGLKK